MSIRKIEFDLDFSTLGNIEKSVGTTKTGDAELVQFIITLENYDKDFPIDKDSQIIMYGTKKDGTKICNSCEINEENKIIYTLHSQDTAVSGLVHYQLVISSVIDGIVKELVSPKFSFCVGNKMIIPKYELLETQPEDWAENYNNYFRLTDGFYLKLNESQAPIFEEGIYYICDGIIESSDEFGALTSALHKAEEFAKKCETLDKEVSEAVSEYLDEKKIEVVGDSAYQVAVDNGYEGSEAEWLESLKGDDGVSITNAYILPSTAGSEAGKLVIEFSNDEGLILDKVVGDSGVYIGGDKPTDEDVDVWIDTNEEVVTAVPNEWKLLSIFDLSSGALSYTADTSGCNELMIVAFSTLTMTDGSYSWKGCSKISGPGKVYGGVSHLWYLGSGVITGNIPRGDSDTLLRSLFVANASDTNNNFKFTCSTASEGIIRVYGR